MKIVKANLTVCIISFIISLIFYPCPSRANNLDNWVMVTPPSDNWYYGMAYGNGTFVTVGAFGTILTSTDGVGWHLIQNVPVTNHLYGVGFGANNGNNTFVAVGSLGTILTSSDNGATWTVRSTGQAHPLSQDLRGVTYGNGKFVVVGADGTILTSTDNGATWDNPFWPYYSPTANWLYGTHYDNNWFVNVGYSGTVLTSEGGTGWNILVPPPTNYFLLGVTYGNGAFIAVGQDGIILASTTNGSSWTVRRAPLSSQEDLYGVAYGVVGGTGYFVAAGDDGTILTAPDTILAYPPDDTDWTVRNWDNNYDLDAVAFDPNQGVFAAAGGFGIIVLDGDSIPTNPVKISEPYEVFFERIQDAYNNLTGGDLKSMALQFNEDVNFGSDKSFTFSGGYDSAFSSNPSYTTIRGAVTISDGTVTVENIVIR